MGQKMNFIGEKIRISDNGFRQVNRLYQAQDCKGCSVRAACHKNKGNRRIEINPRLSYYKSIIRERLTSEQGRKYLWQCLWIVINTNRTHLKPL